MNYRQDWFIPPGEKGLAPILGLPRTLGEPMTLCGGALIPGLAWGGLVIPIPYPPLPGPPPPPWNCPICWCWCGCWCMPWWLIWFMGPIWFIEFIGEFIGCMEFIWFIWPMLFIWCIEFIWFIWCMGFIWFIGFMRLPPVYGGTPLCGMLPCSAML